MTTAIDRFILGERPWLYVRADPARNGGLIDLADTSRVITPSSALAVVDANDEYERGKNGTLCAGFGGAQYASYASPPSPLLTRLAGRCFTIVMRYRSSQSGQGTVFCAGKADMSQYFAVSAQGRYPTGFADPNRMCVTFQGATNYRMFGGFHGNILHDGEFHTSIITIDPGQAQGASPQPGRSYFDGAEYTASNITNEWNAGYDPTVEADSVVFGRNSNNAQLLQMDLAMFAIVPGLWGPSKCNYFSRLYVGTDRKVVLASRIANIWPRKGVSPQCVELNENGDSQSTFASSGTGDQVHAWGSIRGAQKGLRKIAKIIATRTGGAKSFGDGVENQADGVNHNPASAFNSTLPAEFYTALPLHRASTPISTTAANGIAGNGVTATVTTLAAHGLTTGQHVLIRNSTPEGFNGVYVVTNVIDATNFTVANATVGTSSTAATVYAAGSFSNISATWLASGTVAAGPGALLYHLSEDFPLGKAEDGFTWRFMLIFSKAAAGSATCEIVNATTGVVLATGTFADGGAGTPAGPTAWESSNYFAKWFSVTLPAGSAVPTKTSDANPYITLRAKGTGPIGFCMSRVLMDGNPDGFGSNVLMAVGGTTFNDHTNLLYGWTTLTMLTNLVKAIVEWQVARGLNPKLLIRVNLGRNDINDTHPSVDADGSVNASNKAGRQFTGAYNNCLAYMRRWMAAWANAGYDAARLGFIIQGSQSWGYLYDTNRTFAGYLAAIRDNPDINACFVTGDLVSPMGVVNEESGYMVIGSDFHLNRPGNEAHGVRLWTEVDAAVENSRATGAKKGRTMSSTNRGREQRIYHFNEANVALPETLTAEPSGPVLLSGRNERTAVEAIGAGVAYIAMPETGSSRPSGLAVSIFGDDSAHNDDDAQAKLYGVMLDGQTLVLEELATGDFAFAGSTLGDIPSPAHTQQTGVDVDLTSPSSATLTITDRLRQSGAMDDTDAASAGGSEQAAFVNVRIPERYLGVAVFARGLPSGEPAYLVTQRLFEG